MGRRGRDRMVDGFIATYAISTYCTCLSSLTKTCFHNRYKEQPLKAIFYFP
jgi:hypothetical protein